MKRMTESAKAYTFIVIGGRGLGYSLRDPDSAAGESLIRTAGERVVRRPPRVNAGLDFSRPYTAGRSPVRGVPGVPIRRCVRRRVHRVALDGDSGVGRCQVAIDHHHCFAGFLPPSLSSYPSDTPFLPLLRSQKLDLFNRDETLSEKTVHAPTHLDRIMALRATVWDSH